jgi:uncharacterized FlaG/YvyC family protein
MNIFEINKSLKIQKALEIKKNFKKIFRQNMNEFSELRELEIYINKWIKDDSHYSGNIYIKSINKYIIYQLNSLEHTVIKITDKLIN